MSTNERSTSALIREPWQQFLANNKLVDQEGLVLRLLVTLYTTPPRAYHNLRHVLACLGSLRELDPEPPVACELAVWFHDAVYVAGSKLNEEASATLCDVYAEYLGSDRPTIDAAVSAIRATAHGREPAAEIEAIVVDTDLSVLGAAPDEYDTYARSIRAEWAHVDDASFREGRATIMRSFLDRSTIYSTDRGRDLWEAKARANMQREIERLLQP